MGFTSKRVLVPATALALLFAGTGVYLAADIYDQAPGILTKKPKFGADLKTVNISVSAPDTKRMTAISKTLEKLRSSRSLDWSWGSDSPSEQPGYIAGPKTDAAQPSKEQVQTQITALQEAATQSNTGVRFGIQVADTATGEILGGLNANTPMTPASTSKLVAAATGSMNLDPLHQFPTVTYQAGGKLYLKGFGDQLLSNGSGNSRLISGHAGLTDLATKTVAAWRKSQQISQGTALSPINLYYDDSLFGDMSVIADWAAHNNSQYETAPAPMAVFTGLVNPAWKSVYHADPAAATALAFKDQLVAAGLPIGQVLREQVPNGAKTLAEVKSASLHEVEYLALKHSDNMLADLMCRAASVHTGLKGSFPNQIRTAQATLKQLGLQGEQFQNQDCSGLSTQDRIPPSLLVQLLQKSTGDNAVNLHTLPSSLPRSGLDGTLTSRFLNTPAQGRIWAKTGSLGTSRALAGYLTTLKGRTLTFAIIGDSYVHGNGGGVLQLIDTFLVGLVNS